MKMYRRMTSIILAVIVFGSICIPLYATNFMDSIVSMATEHIESMLPGFAASEEIQLSNPSLGSVLSVYRATEIGIEPFPYSLYPIFSGQNIVALASVKGSVSSDVETTIFVDYANALHQYVTANPNEPFAIIYAQEGVFAINRENTLSTLKVGLTSVPYSIENLSFAQSSFTLTTVSRMYTLELNPTPRVHLNVTRVPNTTVSCCGGLCWAASLAMIKNYYDGTDYDAEDIHQSFGCLNHGTATAYIYVLRELGMLDYTYSDDYLTYPILYNFISNDQLLFTRLLGAPSNHIVVGYGYQYNTATAYFQFMDPNTGHNSKAFPLTTGPVTFDLDGYTYTMDYYIATEW